MSGYTDGEIGHDDLRDQGLPLIRRPFAVRGRDSKVDGFEKTLYLAQSR
jgi:hypothetical protein